MFKLTDCEKETLQSIARKAIANRLDIPSAIDSETETTENLLSDCGAFVSIYSDGKLRGCIGQFEHKNTPLHEVVREVAVSAAFADHRFPAINKKEFKQITIEISVLTPMQKISSPEEIVLGEHGIYITNGTNSGTFLPQVATKTGWTLEEFLGHCSKDKAGLTWDGWQTADVYIYRAIVF